jgi:hypothetical protein
MRNLINQNVFVRTVTQYFTGRLLEVEDGFLRLEDAAWIADTGRFSSALTTGKLNEVEPYPGDVFVALSAVVDVCAWQHELPRQVR